ncbi:hypothetical protein E2C01_003723 [Portunus trituberculatus]|uniref:Uncharacterized protein n=1 Tax=Portunus trituberculatus TaxID=210409 RepID=A0A5B7CNG1_PORTR|nr:hypothetical protein [Portunus trituberculatus]
MVVMVVMVAVAGRQRRRCNYLLPSGVRHRLRGHRSAARAVAAACDGLAMSQEQRWSQCGLSWTGEELAWLSTSRHGRR